jgi:hypothetical protein
LNSLVSTTGFFSFIFFAIFDLLKLIIISL